jgi:hypothetical protein
MRRIRQHLTYANVMATIAVFIAISGGTAVALSGSNTVFTDDIANDTQPAAGGNPAGGLAAADLRSGSVGSSEVANESLTGADIQNKSGVDTCVNTARLGDLCFRAENNHRNYVNAAQHCANLNLRLPSAAEGEALATNYDLPNVDQSEDFWTDETIFLNSAFWSGIQDDDGIAGFSSRSDLQETVCVTTPTN